MSGNFEAPPAAAGRPLDDARNVRLAGPYRALWRAARNAARDPAAAPEGGAGAAGPPEPPEPVHSALRRQVEDLLADTGIADAERRLILDSISCPCCGGAGASFAMTIRPASEAGF